MQVWLQWREQGWGEGDEADDITEETGQMSEAPAGNLVLIPSRVGSMAGL